MFKQGNRLNKDKDFNRVFKEGRASYGKLMSIRMVANNLNKNRFGILIGNKISKQAVVRNKIKRRIRESICAKFLFLEKGFDFVVVAFPDILQVNFSDINKEASFLLKRLKIVKTK